MPDHPLLEPPPLRAQILGGETIVGYFLLSGSPMIAEACSTIEIDWLLVDMEASPVTKEGALHQLQAIAGSGVAGIVRVPDHSVHLIEHALDAGASGVLVPKVETAEAAAAVAAAARFPPEGRRGINPVRASGYFADVPGYLSRANERTACLVQIESRAAVERAGEIAAVPDVDGLFVGIGDLASSLGEPGVVDSAAIAEACAKVLAAAQAHGKCPGIFAYSIELARRYAAEGFRFIALGNDFKALRSAIERDVAAFRSAPASGRGA